MCGKMCGNIGLLKGLSTALRVYGARLGTGEPYSVSQGSMITEMLIE